MATIGTLEFAITADNKLLIKNIETAKTTVESLGNEIKEQVAETKKQVASTDSIFQRLKYSIGGAFSTVAISQFIKQVMSVRSEMEALEVSFSTLLGNGGSAAKLVSELREFAVNTPMDLSTLAQGAQQLLAFNIEAEKVMPTLKAIGDISMGDSQKFQSLTLSFAQMSSAGKLMGQDLMQMINAGFNPLAEIAERTGKSIGQLKDDMSKGLITVDMVTQAFMDATSEGGKFNGMLEKQSQTLQGMVSNLKGALSDMMNEVGEQMQGTMSVGFNVATKLVKHYKEVGKAILAIAAAYGSYKAAVIAFNVVQRMTIASNAGVTASFALQYYWITLNEKGMKLLNATMLKNPAVAVGTIIATLITTLVIFRDRSTEASRAQDILNDTMEKNKKSADELRMKVQELIDTIQDETEADELRSKSFEELQSIYPKTLSLMTKEQFLLENRTKLLKKMNEEKYESETKEIVSEYEALKKDVAEWERLNKEWQKERGQGVKEDYSKEYELQRQMLDITDKYISEVKKGDNVFEHMKDKLLAFTKLYNDRMQEVKKAEFNKLDIEAKISVKKEELDGAQKRLDTIRQHLKENPFAIFLKLEEKSVAKLIKQLRGEIEGLENATTSDVKNKAYWEKVKTDAENALAAMDSKQLSSKSASDLRKKIANAQKEIAKYDTSKNTDDDAFKKSLDKKKAEYEKYYKWQNSNNEELVEASKKTFEKLLKGGNSYLDYLVQEEARLKKIADAGKASATQLQNLKTIRNEIAEQQTNTALKTFEESINKEIEGAKNADELMNVIKKYRDALSKEDDGQLKYEKTLVLDKSNKDVEKKVREQTDAQLSIYSKYWSDRIAFERDYESNHSLLAAKVEDAEKEMSEASASGDLDAVNKAAMNLSQAEQALRGLERQYDKYMQGRETGDTDYDALLQEYQNFVDKKEAIEQEFNDKIAIAREHGDAELEKRLEKQRKQSISDLAVNEFKNNDAYKKLFENLDDLTVNAVTELIEQIENETIELQPDIDPETLKKLKKELGKALDEVADKKPFTALSRAIDKFSKEGSDANMKAVLDAGAALAGNFRTISDSLEQISDLTGNKLLGEIAEATEDTIGAVEAIAKGFSNGGYIGAAVAFIFDVVPKIIKWYNRYNEHVVAINEAIETTEKSIEKYKDAYLNLQKEVSKQTGQAMDELNQKLGENIRLQIAQLKTTIATMEQEMKKASEETSGGTIVTKEMKEELANYKKELAGLEEDLANLMDSIVQRTLGNKTISSLLEDLSTAMVDAWVKGENAAESYRNKVKEIVKDIARNMIIQNLITTDFRNKLEKYTKNWTEDTPWEDRMRDIDSWYQEAMAYSDQMIAAMNEMGDKYKEWLSFDSQDESSGLSGAIKGMSQQSADLLAGVANAMRLNQATIINSLSDILIQTTGIRANTALTNQKLEDIYNVVHGSSRGRGTRSVGVIE